MSFFESLLAVLGTKAAAGVAGVTVAVGAVAAAGTTDHLPDDVQTVFDEIVGTAGSQSDDVGEPEETGEPAETGESQDAANNDHSASIHEALTGDPEITPGDEAFGPTVADNAQEGGAEFGMNVADTASGGQAGTDDESFESESAEGERPEDVPVGSDVDEEHTGDQYPDEDDAPAGPETGDEFRSRFSPRG